MQRWTPRRVLLWIALVLGVFLLAADFTSLFTNAEATRAPLGINGLDCGDSDALEAMLLEAQSVRTASLVPCVGSLPVGWSFEEAYVNSGRSIFILNHDRAGERTLEVTFTRSCAVGAAEELGPDVPGARRFGPAAAGGSPVDQTWYEVFPGGCTTTRLRLVRDSASAHTSW